MDIKIIYFSQTGNTRSVAKELAGVCRDAGHVVQTIPLRKVTFDAFSSADLVGLGAPCFGSQAPTPVRDYLHDLPSLGGKKTFVFATSGGAPGRVLWDLANPLKKKGAHVLGGFLCRGVCHYPLPCLVGRFPDRPNQTDLEKARRFAASLLEHIASGGLGPMPDGRPDAFHHGLGFYNILGIFFKDPLLRLMMPGPKADDSCNGCEWCVKECPTNSMRLNPEPEITDTCIRCYRCMNGCPQQALSVNWGISNFMTWTMYNTTFERWFGDVQKGEKFY